MYNLIWMTDSRSHKVVLEAVPCGVVMLAVQVDPLSMEHADSTGHRSSLPFYPDIEKAPKDMSYRTARKLHACRLSDDLPACSISPCGLSDYNEREADRSEEHTSELQSPC